MRVGELTFIVFFVYVHALMITFLVFIVCYGSKFQRIAQRQH
jgi:hypothetical protein